MAFVAPPFVTVNPSFIEPAVLIKYNQASGAFDTLHMGRPEVRLGEGDLSVYIKSLDVRTKVAAGQQAYEDLPSVSVIAGYGQMPTYLNRNRFEFNHHDSAAAGVYGVSIDAALRLASRQGHFQQLRNQLLYGVQASNGEGLLNSPGATSTTLPPDSNNNTTFVTYDNGQLAFYLLTLINQLMQRMYQIGMRNMHTVIVAPQRIIGPLTMVNIVQLVQFQRQGAGSLTTGGTMNAIMEMTENDIEWCVDDTLIGQGAGGTDMMIITMPTVKNPNRQNAIDTNEFSRLMPGLEAVNTMYMDMAAPREIRAPLPGGAIDCVLELRSTPGWNLRPEGLTLLSIPYS